MNADQLCPMTRGDVDYQYRDPTYGPPSSVPYLDWTGPSVGYVRTCPVCGREAWQHRTADLPSADDPGYTDDPPSGEAQAGTRLPADHAAASPETQ